MRPTTELVVFDCDGVLVDSEPIANRVLHAQLVAAGIDITPEDTHRRFIGTSSTTFLRALGELAPSLRPDPFMAAFRVSLFEAFGRELRPVDGVVEVLDALAVGCCVASNSSHARLAFSLRAAGLAHRFAGRAFSAEDVPRPKPDPDLFLHASATLGVAPARCVVVEDTPTGVRAARAAGMRVVGYAATVGSEALRSAGAHSVFDHMRELPLLLG